MAEKKKETKQVEEKDLGYVKWLFELSNKDVAVAGGKGASLAEMFNSKFPVPPAFIITAQAFGKFIKNIKEEIDSILEKTDVNNTKELNEVSKKIRELIEKQSFSQEMEKEILEAYETLGTEKKDAGIGENALSILKIAKEPLFVAVRSSATTEDLATASFAGQQESFLGIKGNSALLEAIKKCFSSLYTPRAIYYREKRGFKHAEALLSVVVQKMINSEKSGVMFTKNPIHEDNNIVIEAVFGLGEGIVSGKIKPDNYLVNKESEVLDKRIAEKKIALVRTSSGSIDEVRLTEEKSNQQVLTDSEIQRLADIGLQLEKHYKKPQDIEFAIESHALYIVQSRPITTKAKEKGKEIEGKVLLQGLSASPGIAFGKVRIVKSMVDLDKIKKDDILVAEMTNPDMVVTMQKSSAIITDEGGSTCFSGETKVLTNKGFMCIKDAYELIKSNQELILLSFDAEKMKPRWKKILSAGKRKSETIKVSCSQTGKIEDNTLDVTPDHKMLIFENRCLIKKQISGILENKEMICLLDKLPESVRLNEPKKAYLIGALLSDGYHKVTMHHTGNPRRGRVVFTQKETPEKSEFIQTVIESFKEIFDEEFDRRDIVHSNSGIRGRRILGIATHFISNKLVPALELTKISQNIDLWVLRLDETSSSNFLAGLIDGDGCFYNNRLHIYVSKENVLQGIILACLNIGIFPQITRNRNIYHVQILERMTDILKLTKRVKGITKEKIFGNKLFSARQILGDITDRVNWKGRIKPYVKSNLLIDSRKLHRIFSLCGINEKKEIINIINSGLRMQRIIKVNDLYEEEVYNLEVEASNELDHNFVVFTKKYTPLLVSNSHAAIVSREMGIPCVVGTKSATSLLKDGQIVTVDGGSGKIYEGEVGKEKKEEIQKILETKTKIKVILDLPDYAERAAKTGCKAVGLLRLEGIIAESGKHPLMFLAENRLEAYSEIIKKGIEKIAEHFESVWIRTSDIRSDEFRNLNGSPKQIELNPMLGFHGIRFSLKNKAILEAELQAAKKVAEKFPEKKIGIMFPQIISVEEVKQAKKIFEKFKKENMEIGIMVETPAACMLIEEFCKEGINFISFGTNDLTQYTLAVDRGNENVQFLYNEMHPAVLREIEQVIEVCKENNVETSICGQAASKPEMAKFLVEKCIDSISVNADAAYEISKVVQEIERSKEEKEETKDISEKETDKEKLKEAFEEEKISFLERKTSKTKVFDSAQKSQISDKTSEKEEKDEIEETAEKEETKEKSEDYEEFPDTDIGFDIFKPKFMVAGTPIEQKEVRGSIVSSPSSEKKKREEYPLLDINLDFLNAPVSGAIAKEDKKDLEEDKNLENDEELKEVIEEMQGKADEEDIDIPEETSKEEDENVLDIF